MVSTSFIKNLLLFVSLFIFSSSCSQNRDSSANKYGDINPDNILIVYLSRTNNTKVIAEIIYKNTGGKLIGLELEKPYPENYRTTVQQVANENESGYLPPLKTKIENIEKYKLIFIGFPTWGMQLPPPMKSFLKQYDLSKKTIVPFNTNGGYGLGSSITTIKELCPDSKILKEFSMKGGSERDGQLLVLKDQKRTEAEAEVKKWLRQLELIP